MWAPVWGTTCRLVIEGAVTKLIRIFNRNGPPPYLTATNKDIFSVWDYVPTRSYLCKTRGSSTNVGSKGIA